MMMRLLYFGFRIYCFIFRPVTIGVRIMLIKDKKVLLVRQTYVPGWFLPGGGVKRRETLEQAARREAREEIGAEMGELIFLGAYTNFGEYKSDHNALFLCTDFTLGKKQDSEIAEASFFSLDELPKGLINGHRKRLEEYRDGEKMPLTGEW